MRDKVDYNDPWTSLENTRHERPNDRRQAELEDREAVIRDLPAGSLSGGQLQYDPSDKTTWWLSDSKEERDFAADFLGLRGPGDPLNPNPGTLPNEGLSRSEKQILHELAEKEVYGGFDTDGVQRDGMDFQRADREQRALVEAAADLFPAYALHYPELAAEKAEAGAAFQRLTRNSGLSKRELARLAKDDSQRDAILQAIAEEQQAPGLRSGEWESRSNGYVDDDSRSTSIGSGYAGGVRRQNVEDTSADSVGSVLRDLQKRSGWDR